MLKSTLGTWLNYATTLFLQVVFASHFGSSSEASAYFLTFSLVIGIAGVFISTAQSLYVPRLVAPDGSVRLASVARLTRLAVGAATIFLVLALCAPLVSNLVLARFASHGVTTVPLVRLAALFGALQVVAGHLTSVAWARGQRFIPAVGPACPSLAATALLLLYPRFGPEAVYLALAAGTALQICLLIRVVTQNVVLSRERVDRLGLVTLVTSFQFAVLTALPFIELLIASRHSSSGGADYNYAVRSLAVVQQLLVGGLVFASLADWSTLAQSESVRPFQAAVAKGLALATLALSFATAAALAASQLFVRVAYQRGSFTSHDSKEVAIVLLVALGGFAGEGLSQVASQALLARRRNRVAVSVGLTRCGVRVVLVVILGLTFGPIGVAAGYSAASLLILPVQGRILVKLGLLSASDRAVGRSTVVVAAGTIAVAGASALTPLPDLVRLVLVSATFGATAYRLRSTLPRLEFLRHRTVFLRVGRSGT